MAINKKRKIDYWLLGTSAILIVLGILVLASVSASLSQERFGTTYYYLRRQILFGLIPGIVLAFFVFKIPLSFLKKWVSVLLLINLALLGAVFLPKIGISFRGAARWVNFGLFSFQPAEFLKLTFILYLAAWISGRASQSFRQKSQKRWGYTLIPFVLIIGGVSLFLILQPNISTLGVIVMCAVLMYFLANTPLWHSFLITLIGLGSLFSLIKLAPYRMRRVLVFWKPETDPMGIGYQIKQSLIAVGSGGISGLGLGMSRQKFGFLPQPMSDSIFAIFSEEAGFIGSLVLVSLFLIFLWRGFKVSKGSADKFSQILALGISSWIVIQAFVNIGAMIGILPLTGIPLPFISYGGSALVAELIGVGILLNISRYSRN